MTLELEAGSGTVSVAGHGTAIMMGLSWTLLYKLSGESIAWSVDMNTSALFMDITKVINACSHNQCQVDTNA